MNICSLCHNEVIIRTLPASGVMIEECRTCKTATNWHTHTKMNCTRLCHCGKGIWQDDYLCCWCRSEHD
jgi:hypothetical protein